MNSMPSPLEPEDYVVRLPVHGSTIVAVGRELSLFAVPEAIPGACRK